MAAHLVGQRLEGNGGLARMLVRGSLRGGAARSRENDECGSGLHVEVSNCPGNSLHQNWGSMHPSAGGAQTKPGVRVRRNEDYNASANSNTCCIAVRHSETSYRRSWRSFGSTSILSMTCFAARTISCFSSPDSNGANVS